MKFGFLLPVVFASFVLISPLASAQALYCFKSPTLGTENVKNIFDLQKKTFTGSLKANCEHLLDYDTRDSQDDFSLYEDLQKDDPRNDIQPKQQDWLLAMIPAEKPQAYIFKTMRDAYPWSLNGLKEVQSFLDGKKQAPPLDPKAPPGRKVIAESIAQSQGFNMKYGSMVDVSKAASHSPAITTAICAEIDVSKSISCGKGLRKIIKWMSFWGGMSLPAVFDDVLQNKKYEAGIVKAAKKIMAKAEGKQPGTSHLFEDLYQSFVDTGSSTKEAKKMAWDTVGLLSMEGATLSMRLRELRDPAYSDKSLVSLFAISKSIPLLDYTSRKKNGETYSFPPGMKFDCHNGKPYHFLMSAYFAHRLVDEEGLDPQAAAEASFVAGKGYQMLASHGTRDEFDILKEPPFSEAINLKRMDLTHEAAGAWYGATEKKLDIDKGLKQLVTTANPPLSNPTQYSEDSGSDDDDSPAKKKSGDLWTALKGAYRFNQVISPNSVFNFYKDEVKRP